ncbi:protoporphyrinogen IX oxidase, oxygen-independen t, HemG [Formosa agariphila KMM 3901]|uniref:Protoporphyrinogen IX dehydrogenase [quinone] n=1 Tax=Formosa agariphila (strain DSM 15362 / KCTC 12365 / LMG 23005 / KMM 3901 / M-2Alg 35-1) TaxID=1347342 RepID=T2KNA9_FORAG|nr:menaquinone-dependent protoporphyrinogen IX dehydrogenase [Formosa agariphila]CDF79479.1 protoporphyrinogen IX oxidase, oxygen-independen t, HemG [Formosa agariphila KMM 3901]
MNKPVGIIYSSTDGQTLKICRRIAVHLEDLGFKTDVIDIASFHTKISMYSKLIIGASIRYGKHHKNVSAFIKTHQQDLERIDTAFFSVNLVARKPDKNTFDTNPYVIKFFKNQDWKPKRIAVFAGRLDYTSYSFFDRLMIKLIMKITNGPTKSDHPIEFTDWERVKDFSTKMSLN